MYEPLLFIHSWVRWIVLLGAIGLFVRFTFSAVRRNPWTSNDDAWVFGFEQVFNLQIAIGLTLWIAASPVVHAALKAPASILKDPFFTFWTLRHPLTMIAALILFQVGKLAAKQRSPQAKFQIFAVTLVTVLATIASAIPWPTLSYGRNLFRGF